MKRVFVIAVASAATLVLSAASRARNYAPDGEAAFRLAESARLVAHFDSVDRELRSRDVSGLSVAQRATRAKLIGWLREYRDAGKFPENDRFPNRVPFFRDSHGTLCAMAYLVDRSGEGGPKIVDRIAKTRNNAYIPELTDDRDLVAWLDASGLSVSEAARIQPTYGSYPVYVSDPNRVSTSYALTSMGLGGTSLGTLGFNVLSPTRAGGGIGLVASLATIIAGATNLDESGGNKKLAITNTTVGSVAAIAAIRALLTAPPRTFRPLKLTPTDGPPPKQRVIRNASLTPDLIVADGTTRVGLRLHAQF